MGHEREPNLSLLIFFFSLLLPFRKSLFRSPLQTIAFCFAHTHIYECIYQMDLYFPSEIFGTWVPWLQRPRRRGNFTNMPRKIKLDRNTFIRGDVATLQRSCNPRVITACFAHEGAVSPPALSYLSLYPQAYLLEGKIYSLPHFSVLISTRLCLGIIFVLKSHFLL